MTSAGRPAASVRRDRILVVGTARSGTSWLAKALGQAVHTTHYPEPDNVDSEHRGKEPGYLGFGPYPLLDPGDEPASLTALWDFVFSGRIPSNRRLQLVAGRQFVRLPGPVRDPLFRAAAKTMSRLPGGPSHRVVKSIYIMFSLDWITERYRPSVVLVQRNPLAVVSSWVKLGISSFDLATRPAIRERHLDRLGVAPPPASASPLQSAAWSVGLLTTVIGEALQKHPEWPLVEHEDLCVDPRARFRAVYDAVGLTWSEASERYLEDSNRPGEGLRPVRVTKDQPDAWKRRLSPEDTALVEETLAAFPSQGWIRRPGQVASATPARQAADIS
jgi:hypothetical protein